MGKVLLRKIQWVESKLDDFLDKQKQCISCKKKISQSLHSSHFKLEELKSGHSITCNNEKFEIK